ncbi:exonuclease domain-containing protein [Telmatospirillum sp. J64-1]|uniref:exonuclease domain-containing protein n=1 Tax=Telmatospirillum sp. J64-1 TaxID=2502183 RepID=UPI00115D5653|nr:exonuclease domain-containing protein [Telmatospirillum sp. J64-1]
MRRQSLGLLFTAMAALAFAAPTALPGLIADSGPGEALARGAGIGFLLMLGVIGLWLAVDRGILRPAKRLELGLRSTIESRMVHRPPVLPGGALKGLSDSVGALVEALHQSRDETLQAIDNATARTEEQKSWLEAILLDLSEGVLVCGINHQILLYNQAAARMLGPTLSVGLGRPLFRLLTRQPVLHSLERLDWRRRESDATTPEELSTTFVCATVDSRIMLQGRMALILDRDRQVTAYVITLVDISVQVASLAKSDAVRRALTRDLRSPVANLRAAAETVALYPQMETAEREKFEQAILKEATALSERIEMLAAQYRGHGVGRWPMTDIYSMDLINCLTRRLDEETELRLTMVGMPLWLQGDSLSLMMALERLLREVSDFARTRDFDVELLLGDRRVYLDITWQGKPVPSQKLETWLDEPLDGPLGSQTLRDVLDRHGSELWSQPDKRPGYSSLRVPLLAPHRPQFQEPVTTLPPRPEFYDFGLMSEHVPDARLADRRLDDLTFVVFDTETTGLRPTEGDEMISIGGVRVVRQRVLTGETFLRLINPGRSIPPDSIRFHGITEDMVRDKPPIQVVLPQFKDFVGEDAILVAHNAAYDLKFVRLKEEAAGVTFRNAVVDTLLLSALVDPDADDHSLDALAERTGVTITDRHTALGDAMATAQILVRLIDRLQARGLVTLGQVMKAANMTAQLRQRERRL